MAESWRPSDGPMVAAGDPVAARKRLWPATDTHAMTEPAPSNGNPDTHITVNAIINFSGAGLLLLVGVLALFGTTLAGFITGSASGPEWIANLLASIGIFVFLFFLALATPFLFAGIGLMRHAEWGRTLTLVMAGVGGIMALLSMTFLWIAVAGYQFWSLTRPEVSARFRPPTTTQGVAT
jgi:hypothetical protein